jgi:hypothetical protein
MSYSAEENKDAAFVFSRTVLIRTGKPMEKGHSTPLVGREGSCNDKSDPHSAVPFLADSNACSGFLLDSKNVITTSHCIGPGHDTVVHGFHIEDISDADRTISSDEVSEKLVDAKKCRKTGPDIMICEVDSIVPGLSAIKPGAFDASAVHYIASHVSGRPLQVSKSPIEVERTKTGLDVFADGSLGSSGSAIVQLRTSHSGEVTTSVVGIIIEHNGVLDCVCTDSNLCGGACDRQDSQCTRSSITTLPMKAALTVPTPKNKRARIRAKTKSESR